MYDMSTAYTAGGNYYGSTTPHEGYEFTYPNPNDVYAYPQNNYPTTYPNNNQSPTLYHTQLTSADTNGVNSQLNSQLNSYTGGYNSHDYPDVNSLEPTLLTHQLPATNNYAPTLPAYHHNSPTASSHTSTGSDESDEYYSWHPYKKSPPTVETDSRQTKPRGKQPKKRKPKKDPNEPQKPVSAYALFFRDTQAAIKGQNPNASFGEVSKIVASMWDSLDTDAKNAYKQKTETAKKDYLKQLAAYRANLISKNGGSIMDTLTQQELSQNQHNKFQLQTQSSPDSTTLSPVDSQKDTNTPFMGMPDIGEKSLASLIAEPTPHQVLTATTTLTVPQSYIPARRKPDLECVGVGETEGSGEWEFHPNQGLVQHCRDVFNIWGQPSRQPSNGGTGTEYAQV